MPDIEDSRKTAEKGAEWVTVKQPQNSRKNSRNTRKTAVLTVFQLFFGCLRHFRVINYAKEFSENFLGSYVNFA